MPVTRLPWLWFVGQFLIFSHVLQGQDPEAELWLGRYGRSKLVDFLDLPDGQLAAVGEVERGPYGQRDIALVLFDKNGNLAQERYLGRGADDAATHLTLRPAGGMLVAGYSTQPANPTARRLPYQGGRDGWLLWLSPQGETQHELLLGSHKDDALVGAWPLPEGGWLAAGQSHTQAWVVALDANRVVVWEKKWQYRQWPIQVEDALLTADQQLFLVGAATTPDGRAMWLAHLDPDGNLVNERVYTQREAGIGYALAEAPHHQLLVGGEVGPEAPWAPAFLATLSRNGAITNYTPLVDRDGDRIHSVGISAGGEWAAAGESRSFMRGARRPKAWLAVLDSLGQQAQHAYFGSSLGDGARAVRPLARGGWGLAGYNGKNVLQQGEGWWWRLGPLTHTQPPGAPQLDTLTAGTVVDDGLAQGLPLTLSLAPGAGISRLRAQLLDVNQNKIDGTKYWLPPLPGGGQQTYWLPLHTSARYVQLWVGDQPWLSPLPLQAPSHAVVSAATPLHLSPLTLLDTLYPNQAVTVGWLIENRSAYTLEGVSLRFMGPENLEMHQEVGLGDLAPGQTYRYNLPLFMPGPGSNFTLEARASDQSLRHQAEASLQVVVPALAPAAENSPNNYLAVAWVSPTVPELTPPTLIWSDSLIRIEVKIVSSHPVAHQNIQVLINGMPLHTGAKFEEASLRGPERNRTLQQWLPLQHGDNQLSVRVSNAAGAFESDAILVRYAPQQANLHILSIGVPSYDLRYTGQDALDFARALGSGVGQNHAFGAIFVDTLTTPQQTTKTEILKTLRRLSYRYQNRQISPQDLLVVFISSHGIGTPDGRFRIAASDFDGPFLTETSLDFGEEIANYLLDIPCTKLFFIDACHSGALEQTANLSPEGHSANLVNWANAQSNNLNIMLSCRADELSYEDETWQNGAFTEALLKGWETYLRQPQLLDSNADNQLDLSEYYDFVRQLTPKLAAAKRPRPVTGQHPLLQTATNSAALPIILHQRLPKQ